MGPLRALRAVSPTPVSASRPGRRARPAWWPAWSKAAGLRTVRAVLVIPSLFALTFEGFGNLQMALFAAFGGFANLIMASFGGTRRDKLIAHLGLAVIGSVGLIIGTAVNRITWLAVLVTIPVTFGIFFAGVAGPNAASGVTAALLPYVLPVATPGTISMIPDRLAGWWLASVGLDRGRAVALAAVPRRPAARGRGQIGPDAGLAPAASVSGTATAADMQACQEAKHQLMAAFASTPYRPVGLATADQGMASVVQLLEWCTTLVADATDGHPNLDQAAQPDRRPARPGRRGAPEIGDLLSGAPDAPDAGPRRAGASMRARPAPPTTGRLPRRGDYDAVEIVARHAFHAQAIAVAVQDIVADTLVATRRADPETIAARRRGWYGVQPKGPRRNGGRPRSPARSASWPGTPASVRCWFLNALRGSLALAAAVLVADLSGVQHGFWVVLGTLSVLRTNAASTESTALRALGGTAVGFLLGALLLLGIGTSPPALWVALPVALAVAAYAPGTLPFALGQAAFTIVVVVLFNLLVPAGWRVGLLRIEDVGIGCLVSLVVGVVFWPRGASSVVGDDLADAFRRGAAYLNQAVDWALGSTARPAGHRRCRGDRRDPAGGGASRLPGRAGRQEGIQGRSVDAGHGLDAAPADRLLAGRPAGGQRPRARRRGALAPPAQRGLAYAARPWNMRPPTWMASMRKSPRWSGSRSRTRCCCRSPCPLSPGWKGTAARARGLSRRARTRAVQSTGSGCSPSSTQTAA